MIEHIVRLFSAPRAVVVKQDDGTFVEEQRYGFTPTSFTEWIGHEVIVSSLDPALRHVLRAVENNENGSVSTLTIQTYSEADVNLSANLSVYPHTPKAQVRAHLHDTGEHLVTAHLDAPLHEGQTVDIGGAVHTVQDIRYPYRDPADAETVEDYQHVTLRLTGETAPVESLGLAGLGSAGGILGLLQ
jgi:hypothetical protein